MELSQRVSPIFSWAAITLGIGAHFQLPMLNKEVTSINYFGFSICYPVIL